MNPKVTLPHVSTNIIPNLAFFKAGLPSKGNGFPEKQPHNAHHRFFFTF